MLGRAASPEAASEETGEERPFVLEAHSYAGGLRVQILGHDPNRPAWVPPQDYVGFRNEIALAPGDHVVEFARFRHRGRKVTCVGLFEPAVDEVFGDRLNHAGVGVWLLERDLLHPDTLLHGLKRLADALVGESGDLLRDNAEAFLGDDYLPAYVVPSRNLPPRLAGWTFVPGPLPETALFAAVDGERENAWALAAEQLLRVSILRGPSEAHGRALILIRAAAAAGDGGLEPIKTSLAGEIVKALPAAMAELSDESRSARMQAEELAARCSDLETALASERARAAGLADRVPALEAEADTLRMQLEGNETYQAWSSLKDQIREVSRQVGQNGNMIEAVRRDILNRLSSIQPRAGRTASSDPSPAPHVNHRQFLRDEEDNRPGSRGRLLFWSMVAVLALLIAALGYLAFTQLIETPAAEVPAEEILPDIDR